MRLTNALILVALLTGCRGQSGATVNGNGNTPSPDLALPIPAMPSIKAVTDDTAKLDGPGESLFKLMRMQFLQARFQVASLPAGVSWVTIQLKTPFGAIWHERRIPYSLTATAPVPSAELDRPVDVIVAKPIPGGYGLDFQIVVGGSALQSMPMEGFWVLSASLDGQSMRAEQALEMRLLP